jgi:hypothetical protein
VQRFRRRGVRVTPALVISMIALFVALSSTGFASSIVPLAKRALTADKAKVATKANNALKLEGSTAAQVAAIPGPATDAQTLNGQTAAQIAATPGPTSSLANSLFTTRSIGWSIDSEGNTTTAKALCNAGERAIAGGWDQSSGIAYVLYDRPLDNGSGWWFKIYADSGDTVPANGSVWVICAKVS